MPKRVLVVAGREGVAPALQAQIEMWGDTLDFSLAASGNEALWEIRGSPYDLVLAPWQVPEMTGMEFAEVVQALSPATKVVLIGVPITPAIRNRAESLGVYALLTQVSPQELAAITSRAVEMPLPRPRPVPPPPPKESIPQEVPLPSPDESDVPVPISQPEPVTPAPTVRPESVAPVPALKITLTPAQQEAVRRALQNLLVSIGPQVAVLASATGDPLVVEGTIGDLPISALTVQAVSALSGAGNLGRTLEDEDLSGLCLFTGSRYDVYTFTVTDTVALLFVFDKTVVEGKLGSVWLYTRRVVDDLRETLS